MPPNRPIRVVLVRPRNPLNIGACARAMGNFGLSELVVVEPYEPIWKEARAAPDAEAVLENARAVATWKEAVAGCALIVWAPVPFISARLSRRSLNFQI